MVVGKQKYIIKEISLTMDRVRCHQNQRDGLATSGRQQISGLLAIATFHGIKNVYGSLIDATPTQVILRKRKNISIELCKRVDRSDGPFFLLHTSP